MDIKKPNREEIAKKVVAQFNDFIDSHDLVVGNKKLTPNNIMKIFDMKNEYECILHDLHAYDGVITSYYDKLFDLCKDTYTEEYKKLNITDDMDFYDQDELEEEICFLSEDESIEMLNDIISEYYTDDKIRIQILSKYDIHMGA